MKRILLMILSAVFVLATLTACGGDQTNPFDTKPQNAETSADTSGKDARQETQTSALPEDTEEVTESETPETSAIPEFSVIPAEWANVEWENYSCVWFTMMIPKGWKVEWQGDASQLKWLASTQDGTIGLYNCDHDYAVKDQNSPTSQFISMYMATGSVQEYFEKLYADSTYSFNVENSCVPSNRDFIQSIRPYTPINDYQSLYATFSEPGIESGEGIYSAVVMNTQDIYIRGINNSNWEINAIFTEWAPTGSLVNWIPVFSEMLNSFRYTDFYIQQWRQIAQSALSTPTVIDDDPVMAAFEERSRSDTIIQEKRSDMLEEYDRVYDTQTGDIYRAYEGFLDDMGDQSRYVPVTDDQYTQGYVGWIDKD